MANLEYKKSPTSKGQAACPSGQLAVLENVPQAMAIKRAADSTQLSPTAGKAH